MPLYIRVPFKFSDQEALLMLVCLVCFMHVGACMFMCKDILLNAFIVVNFFPVLKQRAYYGPCKNVIDFFADVGYIMDAHYNPADFISKWQTQILCHVLIIATLFFLTVLSISETNYRRFRTMLLALSGEFLKLTTFLLMLLLFIGCPLIYGYSTNSCLTVIIACLCYDCLNLTAPDYLTELLRIYKPTRQLRSSSDISILCSPTVRTYSLGQRLFSYAAPSLWNTPLQNQVIKHLAMM